MTFSPGWEEGDQEGSDVPGHSTHMHATHAHCTRMHNGRGAGRSKQHFKDTVRPSRHQPVSSVAGDPRRWPPHWLVKLGTQVSFYISVPPMSPLVGHLGVTQQAFSSWYNPELDSRLQGLMDYRVGVICAQGSGQGKTGLGRDGGLKANQLVPKLQKQPTQEKEKGSVSTWSNQNRHLKETNHRWAVRARLGMGQSEQAQRARAAPEWLPPANEDHQTRFGTHSAERVGMGEGSSHPGLGIWVWKPPKHPAVKEP